MGYRLYRQIRDFAPQDWTSGELVVALMIADAANDGTRHSYLDASELARRARMSARGVRKCLEKLADKGFEFRVSKGKDSTGREVFAVPGTTIEYQVPDIFMRLERGAAVAYGLVDNLSQGGTTVPPDGELSTGVGGTTVPLRRYHSTALDELALLSFELKTI